MNKNRILSLLTAAILLGTTVAAPIGEAQAAQQEGSTVISMGTDFTNTEIPDSSYEYYKDVRYVLNEGGATLSHSAASNVDILYEEASGYYFKDLNQNGALDTYEDVLETLAFYGELTGKKDTAQAKIDEIKAGYEQAVAKAEGKEPPKSLMIWGTMDSFSMATSKSFAGNLIYRLGGNNIADNVNSAAKDNSGFIPLSMEYIATQNPEAVFIVTHGDPKAMKAELDNTLGTNPLWQEIDAVKNGRVYVLPYQLFAVNPGTRIADALNILADDMYNLL